MCESLKKYKLIFDQIDELENHLQNGANPGEIDQARLEEHRARCNFPLGNPKV